MDDDARSLRRHPRPTGAVAHELEESTVLALWLTAWLRGEVGPDDTRDAVVAEDAAHDVVLPDEQHTTPLVLALGQDVDLAVVESVIGMGAQRRLEFLAEASNVLAGSLVLGFLDLQVGKSLYIHVLDGRELQRIEIRVLGKERVETPVGAMQGHYRMVADDGEHFDAQFVAGDARVAEERHLAEVAAVVGAAHADAVDAHERLACPWPHRLVSVGEAQPTWLIKHNRLHR